MGFEEASFDESLYARTVAARFGTDHHQVMFHPDRVRRVGLFFPEAVSRLVREHVSGEQNHQRALWTLLAFELWREAYLPRDTWT